MSVKKNQAIKNFLNEVRSGESFFSLSSTFHFDHLDTLKRRVSTSLKCLVDNGVFDLESMAIKAKCGKSDLNSIISFRIERFTFQYSLEILSKLIDNKNLVQDVRSMIIRKTLNDGFNLSFLHPQIIELMKNHSSHIPLDHLVSICDRVSSYKEDYKDIISYIEKS